MLRWLPLPAILLACGSPAPESGVIVLTPTEEARPYVEAAAKAWGAVAPVVVGKGGVPVSMVEQTYALDGSPNCASTIFRRSGKVEVQITRAGNGCAPLPLLVLHEIGHVLCRDAGCHSEHGIMGESCNPTGSADVIDQESVDAVCLTADCFQPIEE